MLRLFALLAFIFVTTVVYAGEVQEVSVSHRDGIYTLDLDIIIASRFESVYALVTDYERLSRISAVLVETSLLSGADAEITRRRLVTRICILFFCFKAKMVEDVWEDETSIITKIIPEQSDYEYGRTEWHINVVDDEHSRIHLFSELKPDFWIPPFIGPFLMKQKMMSEAKKTINRIEELAGDG